MSFGLVMLGAIGLAFGLLVIHVATRMASDWKAATRRRDNCQTTPS